MSTSTAWPVEGQGLIGEVAPSMTLPFPLASQGQEGATEELAVCQLLTDVDFWRFPDVADQGVNGQVVDRKEAARGRSGGSPSPEATTSPAASPETLGDRDEKSDPPAEFHVHRSKNIYVELPKSTLVHPRSQHEGFTPPLSPSTETSALASLMEFAQSRGNMNTDFIEFELDSFSFYVNSAVYSFEMRPLQHMATRFGHGNFFFDGILSVGPVKHYVQKVPISELPIGNYGASHSTVRGQIWVRSKLNAKREIYYRLRKASTEYARFYTPFMWVADLAKHTVDYSAAMINRDRRVGLDSFKEHFIHWLCRAHSKSAEFQRWRRKHPSDDYRTWVTASIDFIWKEMNGVLGWTKAQSLQLFREAIHFTQYQQSQIPYPRISMVEQGCEQAPPTIVTPFIRDCFGHMVIGKILKVVGRATSQYFGPETPQPLDGRIRNCTAPSARIPLSKRTRTSEACFLPLEVIDQIKIGDTISTPRDGDTTDTKWRSVTSEGKAEDDRWFGLVQKVHVAKDKSRSFDVSWFYRPADTPCCLMKYPWSNELFLSDHCTCEEGQHARVKEHEILATHNMDWFGSPNGTGEFFARQTYIIEGRRWVTLQKSHLTCSHNPQRLGFRTGDSVLVSSSQGFAEPHEVVKVFRQGQNMFVRLRRLLFRSHVEPQADAAPNELVYTDQLVVVKPARVVGKCIVRFFKPGESIPTPYDRGGTGNLFYITHRLEARAGGGDEKCVPFDDGFPTSLRQGFDPTQPLRKLRGMDLFCGSGNFGRGLEEGGAVEMRWANDIWDRAIHTYMANSPDPKSTKPFLGSVDDLLRLALEGKHSDNVPRPGEVDFISAGSPCPGFSLLTPDKTTLAQIKNQSLVASFASFVDFYRPKYGILENVSTIVQARHNRSEDVLCQLFCAIVGMGYQAQLVLGDAWSHGTPQSRSRVFLYFAAPGLRLPEAPLLSHSHYPGVNARGLGEMCNGEPFVRRSFQPTPFKYVSAGEGTADLPLIDDGKAEPGAIAFPDHRVSVGLTSMLRDQIAAIPVHPHGMSFAKAWQDGRGVMSRSDRELFPAKGTRVSAVSHGWRRVKPNEVFQTVTTRGQPTDARAGTGVHWLDDRPLTIQEVRRAQGFPDHEVLLGSRADQWKLVGNSVARQMALALGLKFREAWVEGMGGGERASGSQSVSVEVASVASVRGVSVSAGDNARNTAAAAVGAVRRNGYRYRRSTSRTIQDLTVGAAAVADNVLGAATENGHGHCHGHGYVNSHSPDIIDLASPANVYRRSMSGEVVDLSLVSRSTTPASTTSETVKAGGMRKRLLSQSLQQDLDELPSRKVICLERDESNSEPDRGSTNGADGTWTPMGAEVEAAAPLPAPEEGEAMPRRKGPTIVRLRSPEGTEESGQ